MNSISIKALLIICLLICLTGCWNSMELTEVGFLMGVSLDQTEDGSIELNAQVYSPMETVGGAGAGGGKPPYINIKTVNESLFDAARDLPRYFGRRAQWSHMRIVLIGEQFAKEHDIGEVLDYFYRDHETRLNMLIIITKGKAADYWKQKPFIERSMGQQLRTIIENSANVAGKTNRALLFDTLLKLNSKVKTTMIPYIETTEDQQKSSFSSGAAVISKGKMVDRLTSDDVQKILMLTNEFKLGVIEFPCVDEGSGKNRKKETLEIRSIHTKIGPKFSEKPPTVHMLTKIEGVVGELRCTSITTKKEIKKLENHIKKMVKEDLETQIEHLQEKKADVFGIGNKLYQQDPALWKKWEKDWDDIFADIKFVVDVEVKVQGTGMPLGEKVTEE
ncbi:Ger(x)C family spore germination protein [Metabacillus arenae]|uniref:Ger(X)C family spore germination protein n=1 Tax=Metabacillus arenae TaxID=2771434 RepID=A0A926NJT3_9BACI|nr:Ger(x)C family spore germination protein [Metabacillus arenae]MBD1379392.1 Ger(x)C family spore germination protein [Metabacillus arenae]